MGEPESFDLRGLKCPMPALIARRRLSRSTPGTVIIVETGSIVNLPWLAHANKNQATVWAGYGGQRAEDHVAAPHQGIIMPRICIG